MIETKSFIKNLLNELSSKNFVFKRNIVKEYLQVLVLNFIYSNPKYSQLYFYGGSCLMHCHSLPRLSEDLDFVDVKKNILLTTLAKDLELYFQKNTDLKLTTSIQKFRIYLKFPILYDLKMAQKSESDLLYLKIEVYSDFEYCNKYQTEIIPLFKFNQSILIKTFDLATLMSTKIRAVLYRKWKKIDKSGNVIAKVKGRDYFDLIWYLQKGIKPNIKCLEGFNNIEELKKELLVCVKNADIRSIRIDLESLIDDGDFIKNLSKNIKEITEVKIKENFNK